MMVMIMLLMIMVMVKIMMMLKIVVGMLATMVLRSVFGIRGNIRKQVKRAARCHFVQEKIGSSSFLSRKPSLAAPWFDPFWGFRGLFLASAAI